MPARFGKESVGPRVRALREARGYSLRELAGRAEIAASFLSKIEASKASPTIMSLVKILEALGVEIAAFFAPPASDLPVVFPRAGMHALDNNDRTWWYAFPEHKDIRLVMTYEEYKPKSRVLEEEKHREDLAGFVIDGTLTLTLPGQEPVRARAGDGFYLRAGQRHTSRNEGSRTLKMVVVQPRAAKRER